MPQTKLKNTQLPDTISSKTVDNTNTINTTTTNLKVTGGSNGQLLSTDGSGNLSWATGAVNLYTEIVSKTADETVSGTTTLQNDDHLFFTADASSIYRVIFEVVIERATTTAGTRFTIQWTYPTGTTGSFTTEGGTANNINASAGVLPDIVTSTLGPLTYQVQTVFKTSTTSGTIQLKWGLGGGTESITLKKGSRILIRKL